MPTQPAEDIFQDEFSSPTTDFSTPIEHQSLLLPTGDANVEVPLLRTQTNQSWYSHFEKLILYYQKLIPIAFCPLMGRRRPRHFLCLRDQRKLRYMIDGPVHLLDDPSTRNSIPVIFAFHAMFLSGASFFQNPPPNAYIVVSMNRPGYHGSSPVAIGKYSYSQFAEDVKELADHLGIENFSVVGHSSGGPNALAVASFLKDQVLSIGIMAGDPEYAEDENNFKEQREGKMVEPAPSESTPQEVHNNSQQQEQAHASPMMDWFMGWLLPNFMRFVPFVHVTNGLKNDFYLERQKWPFQTEDITQPAVVVLGDQDSILPNEVAVKVHNRLPNSLLKLLGGVGHNELLDDDILDMIFRTVVCLAEESKGGDLEKWTLAPANNSTTASKTRKFG